MSLDNLSSKESSASKNTTQRRTFLKRTAAGVVIASIPGRSAWAGIAGSIVASGHGSDFNQGACTKLLGAHDFDHPDYRLIKFSDVFGGNPFNRLGNVRRNAGIDGKGDLSFGNIIDAQLRPGTLKNAKEVSHYLGVNSVNVGLIVMYLNAANHGFDGIEYPVLEQHGSATAFADYLYREASADRATIGTLLNGKINDFSSGVC